MQIEQAVPLEFRGQLPESGRQVAGGKARRIKGNDRLDVRVAGKDRSPGGLGQHGEPQAEVFVEQA